MTRPSDAATSSERGPQHQFIRPRRRLTVLGVIGEVFITGGVLVLLYLCWQLWWNPLVLSGAQTSAAATQSRQWIGQIKSTPTPTPINEAAVSGVAAAPVVTAATPPVMQPVSAAQPFAVLYVPRFGADYKRVIKETVDEQTVLNSYTSGIGHYPGTQMPGAVGNFAIAGHDTGWGNALIDVTKLQLGDKIYIQTQDGWYTYEFRNFEYVQPNAVNVLWPIPRTQSVTPADRLITITTCNPPWHSAERVITYGVFDTWQPLTAGAPAAIAATVAAQGG